MRSTQNDMVLMPVNIFVAIGALRKSNTRLSRYRSCGSGQFPLVSKADVKATGQPSFPNQLFHCHSGFLHEQVSDVSIRRTHFVETGKVCLPNLPQIRSNTVPI